MKIQQAAFDIDSVAESLRQRCIGPLHQARFIKNKDIIDSLERRAKLESKKKFLEVMAKIPDVEPEEYDKL